jgi:arylsulfatase A-like enzyme
VRRNILFITTDQQRFDSLGCNGGTVARTPVVDRLAAEGVRYERAHTQSPTCMPSRSTMMTGQYPRTHGVWGNGVALPPDAPSIAAYLRDEAGYSTALIGKAHFEPALAFEHNFPENTMGVEGSTGPHRGFDHLELAMHTAAPIWHYGVWLHEHFPHEASGFFPVYRDGIVNVEGGGDTGAPQVAYNPVAREHYHTDWVTDRTIAHLRTLGAHDPWFVWMSFPDPHHPWDPPASERHRCDWRDLDLPDRHPGSADRVRDVLAGMPPPWLAYYEGTGAAEGPGGFAPTNLTHDQIREVNALVHVKNELIDEACGRVVQFLEERGDAGRTDIFFTSDHGELQGDYGLLFKGPFNVDSLLRVPLVWRPAPAAAVQPAVVPEPVGLIDLPSTFCEIARLERPDWVHGAALPVAAGSGRERVLTEWDSEAAPAYESAVQGRVHFEADVDQRLRTIFRDGYTCTVYEGAPYGELFDAAEDPLQWRNVWSDPAYRAIRTDLVADLYDSLPPPRAERLQAVSHA